MNSTIDIDSNTSMPLGTLSTSQSASFSALVSDDSKVIRADQVMNDAKACLYWFQRPFAQLLVRNPCLTKFVAEPGPSRWDRKVDAAERRAAQRAEKAAQADMKAKTSRFLQGLAGL